ncbi:MAG: hybrid sensor histidine kinase/response regulator, partial [Limnobacter sp.]|nr:hybrid sensor histidine kinase/response regulator [Limnobacter sp.]
MFALYRAANESARYYQITVLRQTTGTAIRVHGVVLDVTEFVQARVSAESEDKAKAEFLATVSHELRTPLNGIIGFSRLLAAQLEKGTPLQQDAQNIVHAAQSLHVLVNDVLDYSQISARGVALDSRPVSLHKVVETVFQLNLAQAQGKGLQFTYANELPNAPVVLADANRLIQVMQNLVNNAIKFTDSGFVRMRLFGTVRDDTQLEAILQVTDSGIGMSIGEQQSLFVRFFQANREIQRHYGGTGLGLAITSGLVKAMGGNIEVKSSPNAGTSLTVRLVFNTTTELEHDALFAENGIAPLRILVVDDHPINLNLLDRFCR